MINEFVSDPDDGEVEWLELYNRINREIDLTGWHIEDGSKSKTNLSGSLAKYKVIEKPAGGLNNGGDLIVLYDASGKIIDQVAYGNWNSGDAKTTSRRPAIREARPENLTDITAIIISTILPLRSSRPRARAILSKAKMK